MPVKIFQPERQLQLASTDCSRKSLESVRMLDVRKGKGEGKTSNGRSKEWRTLSVRRLPPGPGESSFGVSVWGSWEEPLFFTNEDIHSKFWAAAY